MTGIDRISRRRLLRTAAAGATAGVAGVGTASAHGCSVDRRTVVTADRRAWRYRPRTDDPCRVVVDVASLSGADLDLYLGLDGRVPDRRDNDRRAWSTRGEARLVVDDPGGPVGVAVDAPGEYRLVVREGGDGRRDGGLVPAGADATDAGSAADGDATDAAGERDGPAAAVAFDRRPYTYDETVTFRSDAEGSIDRYDWTIGSAAGPVDRSGPRVSFRIDRNGDREYGDAHGRYDVAHSVTDDRGRSASTTERFHVLPDSLAIYQDRYLTEEFGLAPARVVERYVADAFAFLESRLEASLPDPGEFVTVHEAAPVDSRDERYRPDGDERTDGDLLADFGEWVVENDRMDDGARHLVYHSEGAVRGPGVTGVPHSAAPGDALADLDPASPGRFVEKGRPRGEHVQRTMHELGHNLSMGERVGVHYDADHPAVDWTLPDEDAVYTTPQDTYYDGRPNACGDHNVDPDATETYWWFWERPKYDTHYADAYWWPHCAAARMANLDP